MRYYYYSDSDVQFDASCFTGLLAVDLMFCACSNHGTKFALGSFLLISGFAFLL